MHFLVTNDDGFAAPGIVALTAMAAEFGDVTVVAPSVEQSYAGHRVSVATPLPLTELGPGRFHLAGTPADCVRVAVKALGLQPDFVLSGINRGGNLGADAYISGTVAASREGALLGIPAIAFSQFIRRPHAEDWAMSGQLATRAFEHILRTPRIPGRYWNVNLPHPVADPDAIPLVECALDPSPLDIRYEPSEHGFIYCGHYISRPSISGYDVAHCFSGALTVTALHL